MENNQASKVTTTPMDQEEGGKGLSQPAPDWQSSLSDVRERNAVMLEKGLLADVYFIVGSGSTQRRIAAHKCMLVAGSSVFHAMFIGGLAEDKEVSITDVEPDAFINLLKCLYCDEISLEADTVLSTLYAAKKYIIPHLACACVEYLESNLDASNACVLLSQCRLFEEPDLVRRCWDVINTHTEEVLQSDGFSDMDYQTLEQILGRDSLDVKETEVFAAAARWAEAECTRQGRDTSPQQCREVLGDALYLLRFPTMTPRDFADGAGSSGLLSMQETYDVLFYLTATNKPKVPFPTSCRKKRHKRCLRFTCIVKDNKGWGYSGRWDSIQFSVDKCISVVGFGLYGSRESSVEYPVTIELKQGGRQLLRKTHTIFCDGSSDTFDVLFDSPFQIQANTYYTASLYLKNAKSSHYGTQGMSSVSCDGVNFNFNEYTDVLLVSQNNGTRVNSGQIPEILYYC